MDPFVGEVRMFPYYAPQGWALCNGQMLPIAGNKGLFNVIGNTFGGDGQQTFALPNYQGFVVVGAGQGANLSPYKLGDTGGAANVAIYFQNMASHTHPIATMSDPGTENAPGANTILARASNAQAFQSSTTGLQPMGSGIIGSAGAVDLQTHPNMMPAVTVNYCIAIAGIQPNIGVGPTPPPPDSPD